MIEQFLDFCKLYPVARFWRGFDILHFGEDWKRQYEALENKGVVLLQRPKRLENRKTEILSEVTRFERQQEKELYSENHQALQKKVYDELYDVYEKLLQTRRLYVEHLLELRRLLSTKEDNTDTRAVFMARKPQYSLIPGRDKSYIWLKGRADCARSGGCCGRECGCCEIPLQTTRSVSGWFPRMVKKKVHFHGHCTAECGCCIKHNGAYVPDPMFKS